MDSHLSDRDKVLELSGGSGSMAAAASRVKGQAQFQPFQICNSCGSLAVLSDASRPQDQPGMWLFPRRTWSIVERY